jgi:hypothetical protein
VAGRGVNVLGRMVGRIVCLRIERLYCGCPKNGLLVRVAAAWPVISCLGV